MNFNRINHTEIFGNEREEAILQQFRSLLSDLVRMLRHSTGAKTIALHWVNRQREIFVPEAYSSSRTDVVFKDRIPFDETFLSSYKDQSEAVWLKLGNEVSKDQITHYYDRTYSPTGFIYIQPFLTNHETVALTVIETDQSDWNSSATEAISAFSASLDNLLHTYLELSNLLEAQKGWLDYDRAIDELMRRRDPIHILWDMARLAHGIIPQSEVSLFVKEFTEWKLVGTFGQHTFFPGTSISKSSLAYDALKSDAAMFSIHINGNPTRVASNETPPKGASIAVPIKTSGGSVALLMVNHPDALSFHDANRHQLLNMARVVGLKLDWLHKNSKSELFHAANGSLKSEFSDAIIEHELDILRSADSQSRPYHVWVGYASLVDFSTIRTRHSSEEIKVLHQHVLQYMTYPENGVESITLYHTDHIYGFIVFGKEEDGIQKWGTSLNKRLSTHLKIQSMDTPASLHMSAVRLQPGYDDAFSIHDRARKALNSLIRKTDPNLQVLDEAGD
jgi:hypothetical protein